MVFSTSSIFSLKTPNFLFASTSSPHASKFSILSHSLSFSNNRNRISLRCFASWPIHVVNPIVEMDD
ncbi:hypothetical protein RYX36_008430 [Vicia faba]